MWKKLIDWLKPPVFPEDEEKTQTAALLNSIVLSMLAATVLYTALARVADFGSLINIILPLYLLLVGMLFLMRRGKVWVASTGLVAGVWLILLYASYINGGVRAPAYSGFIVVVMIASFLLSARMGILVAGLSVAAGVILIVIEERGSLPVSSAPQSLFTVLLAQVTYFIVAAVLLALATRSIRQALALVHASEERYRLIASVISDYAFSIQYDGNGMIEDQWLGGAFEKITGYTSQEYFDRGGWRTIVHPDDLEQDDRDMEQLGANQRVVAEIRIIRKDGNVRWVRAYGHPLWDEEHEQLTGIYGAVQDITDRKQVEQHLHQRAEEISLLYHFDSPRWRKEREEFFSGFLHRVHVIASGSLPTPRPSGTFPKYDWGSSYLGKAGWVRL